MPLAPNLHIPEDDIVSPLRIMVGLDAKFIYLKDPAFPDAPIRMPRNEFDLARLEKDESYAVLIQQY